MTDLHKDMKKCNLNVREYFGLCEVQVFARSAAPDCGQPEVPVYGRVAAQRGGAVTYSCSQGYTLLGPATRNCSQQGWQGPVPVCKGGPLPPAISWFDF